MSKIKNGGLDQYGPEHFELQPFDSTGLERVRENFETYSLRSGVFRCTANDLKMVSRLIKHDLRINAGARQMYASLVDSSALGICCPMQALGAGG